MPGMSMCEKHQETLKLFCEDDHTAICLVCRESRDHKHHTVLPIEEAAEDYKKKIQNWLGPLKLKMGESRKQQHIEIEHINLRKTTLEMERRKVVENFKLLHQHLETQRSTILLRIEEMEKKISMVENVNISKWSNKISSLGKLIDEIEQKCKQPASDLLKDVKDTLSRCNNMKLKNTEAKMTINKETPGEAFATARSQMEDTINSVSKFDRNQMKRNSSFYEDKAQAKKAKFNVKNADAGSGNMAIMKKENMKKYKAFVTLDLDTASPWLILSKGRRKVSNKGIEKDRPKNPKRFVVHRCVLGSDGFTSGRHYWEVEVLKVGDGWCLGAAGESVKRNKRVTQSPEEAVWAVGRWGAKYVAFSSPETSLSPNGKIRKLGVYLDYEEGELSLYNADTTELLHTFTCAFKEKIFPYFNIRNRSALKLVKL